MKLKLKRLFAALCAAVTAFCCAALPVSAKADIPYYPDGIAEEFRAAIHAEPVYALGRDAQYALGDVNMDGKIDSKDSTLVLWEHCVRMVCDGEMGVLDAEQLALADVDGKSNCGLPVTCCDSCYILKCYAYHNAGFDVTVEQLVANEIPEGVPVLW